METALARVRKLKAISGTPSEWTKARVAKRSGCHKSHYGRIESGASIPRPALAEKIVEVFGGDITERQLMYPAQYASTETAPKRRKAA